MRGSIEADGPERRWRSRAEPGSDGAELDPVSLRLLAFVGTRISRLASAGRAAGSGTDQVAAERLVDDLTSRGLARIRERRTRRGDWEAYQWEATPAGRALVPRAPAPNVEAWLQTEDGQHPILSSIRTWLLSGPAASDTEVALVLAIGEEIRRGRMPRGRLLSVSVGGHTKALRVQDHRVALEAAFGGFALEAVVRLHGRAVLAFGNFAFVVGEHSINGRWSVPWLALTPETVDSMTRFETSATRVLTVENLVAFEEQVRAGVPSDTIMVYTSGFPGHLERAFLERLIRAGVNRVDHWGDLDVGGLRILRHLQTILPVRVHPYRMDVKTLDLLPPLPLTERDRLALAAWLADEEAPLRELAQALLTRGVKAEQEGWFLVEMAEAEAATGVTVGGPRVR